MQYFIFLQEYTDTHTHTHTKTRKVPDGGGRNIVILQLLRFHINPPNQYVCQKKPCPSLTVCPKIGLRASNILGMRKYQARVPYWNHICRPDVSFLPHILDEL